jgi:hypothetical protein
MADHFGRSKQGFYALNPDLPRTDNSSDHETDIESDHSEEDEEASDEGPMEEEESQWQRDRSDSEQGSSVVDSEMIESESEEEEEEEYDEEDDPIIRIDDDGNEYVAQEGDEAYGDTDPPRLRADASSEEEEEEEERVERPRQRRRAAPSRLVEEHAADEMDGEAYGTDVLADFRKPEVCMQNSYATPFRGEEDFASIAPIYTASWRKLGRKPVILCYEFSEDCFLDPSERNAFMATTTVSQLHNLTVSMIKHGDSRSDNYDPKSYHAKLIMMMLCRACTIGMDTKARKLKTDRTEFGKRRNQVFEDSETGTKTRLNPGELLISSDDSVRYHPDFCTHTAYAHMLHESASVPTFKLIEDESIGERRVRIPEHVRQSLERQRQAQIARLAREERQDIGDNEYSLEELREAGFSIPGGAECAQGTSVDVGERDYGIPPVPEMVSRPQVNRMIHLIPQFDIFWEELVDSNYQRRGYRLWIRQNDPAINLGRNMEYMMDDNRERLPTRQRTKQLHYDTATCYGNILHADFSRMMRKKVLGDLHPINNLPEEASIESHVYENNALHIANLFHPFYIVSRCDLVKGVCPAQRNPENYFDMHAGILGDRGDLSPMAKLNAYFDPDTLRNALRDLPPFAEAFPFPELMKWTSFRNFEPGAFWNERLPKPILVRCRNDPIMVSRLRDRVDRLTCNPYIGVDPSAEGDTDRSSRPPVPGSEAHGRVTCGFVDEREETELDWERMINLAAEMQTRAWNGELIHEEDYEISGARRNTRLDPLAYLGISEEIKRKFYKEDEMLCFRAMAVEKMSEIEPNNYLSVQEWRDAMENKKKELLIDLERREMEWLNQDTKRKDTDEAVPIPKSYLEGLKWEQSFSAEEMWPESALCIEKSDTGKRMSLWANMILHLYDCLSEVFLLNEGEPRFLAIRTLCSRNSALCEDAQGIGAYNQLLHGKSGVGKSYPVECISAISAPGHVKVMTDVTMGAFQTDTNRCYEWLVFHELPSSFFTGGDAGKGKNSKGAGGSGEDSTLKMLITSGFTTKERNHYEDGKSRIVTSASRAKISITGITNDNIKNMSPAMLQRLCVDAVSVSENSVSNAVLSAEEHISWLRPNELEKDARKKKLAYWTHWLPHKLERRIGIFQDVNMDVYNILMPAYSKFLQDKYGITIGVRKQKQLRNACRSMVIIYAVYAHFMCEVSRIRGKSATDQFRRMRSEDFLGIEKYMVFDEEMFVTMMTVFHRILLPTIECEVMEAMVRLLSKQRVIHPQLVNPDTEITFDVFKQRFHSDGLCGDLEDHPSDGGLGDNPHGRGPTIVELGEEEEEDSEEAEEGAGRARRRHRRQESVQAPPTREPITEAEQDVSSMSSIQRLRHRMTGLNRPSATPTTTTTTLAGRSGIPRESEERRPSSLFFAGGVPHDYEQRGQGYVQGSSGGVLAEGEGIPTIRGDRPSREGAVEALGSSLTNRRRATSGTSGTQSSRNPRRGQRQIFDQNFCFVGKSMKDMVDSIKSEMTNKYPDSLIYAVLYSFREKVVKVHDMNNPSRVFSTKVLSYMQISRRPSSGGGYGSYNSVARREGAWFLNTAAPFEHFPGFSVDKDLKEFIQKDVSFPASYMTFLSYKNSPGYLSVLKTVDIDPVDKPMTKLNGLPPSISWNATVHNNFEGSMANGKRVSLQAAVSGHDIDEHPDFLAYLRHYWICGLHFPLDLGIAHHGFKTPLMMAAECADYRVLHHDHYKFYCIIRNYPSDKLKEIEKRHALEEQQQIMMERCAKGEITPRQYHNEMKSLSITRVLFESLMSDLNKPQGYSEDETEWFKRLPRRERMSSYNPRTMEDLSASIEGPPDGGSNGSGGALLLRRSSSEGILMDQAQLSLSAMERINDSMSSLSSSSGVIRRSVSSLPAPHKDPALFETYATSRAPNDRSGAIYRDSLSVGSVQFEDPFAPAVSLEGRFASPGITGSTGSGSSSEEGLLTSSLTRDSSSSSRSSRGGTRRRRESSGLSRNVRRRRASPPGSLAPLSDRPFANIGVDAH